MVVGCEAETVAESWAFGPPAFLPGRTEAFLLFAESSEGPTFRFCPRTHFFFLLLLKFEARPGSPSPFLTTRSQGRLTTWRSGSLGHVEGWL